MDTGGIKATGRGTGSSSESSERTRQGEGLAGASEVKEVPEAKKRFNSIASQYTDLLKQITPQDIEPDGIQKHSSSPDSDLKAKKLQLLILGIIYVEISDLVFSTPPPSHGDGTPFAI